MNNLKRMIALLLALACMASFTACGADEKANDETTDASQKTTQGIVDEQDEVMDMIESVAQENSGADVGTYEIPAEADFIWEDTDGGVAITNYSGSITAVEVPAQLGGKNVVEIREGAFTQAQVVGVKLPDTVVTIGNNAFYYNTTLVELILGAGTKTLSENACAGCVALTNVKLNDGLEVISEMAFSNATSLKSIALPDTLTEIGGGAFVMSGLTNISIPAGVKSVGKQAFSSCSALAEVTIKSGVESIGERAFEGCGALEHVEIPASVETFEYGVFMYADNVTVYAPAGSAAESYASEFGHSFKAN